MEAPGEPETRHEAEARRRFHAGATAVEEGDYEAALRHFTRAYELRPHPALLYNIANAADRLRRDELAAGFYRRYLEETPEAENRRFVEHRLELIEARAREHVEPEPPEVSEPEPPPPAAEPSDLTAAWVVLIGSLAGLAGGGALLAVGLVEQANVERASDGARWSELEGSYQLAEALIPSGLALVGLGAALAGVGLVLALESGSDSERVVLRLGPAAVQVGVRL